MFKKILVAEDIESINQGVHSILERLQVQHISHAQYCDDALLRIKRAIYDKNPFELLICDLSFKKDHRNVTLSSGQELIALLKKEQPNLKIIVFTIEDHPQIASTLINDCEVEGYVLKNRKGLAELEEAIKKVAQNKSYISPQLATTLKRNNLVVLPEYEIQLLTHLANGLTQDQIELHFKKQGITPNSRSAIEKRLKDLRDDFNAQTTVHLVTIVKDLQLI
ncbi:response regulator [Spongiivirga citrea]|uniref:Response regulator n=1 Tax=Spongiivirga citrea TaxID=1481457 RepID=A0A6M0CJ52_9FLAO|nr:response regulator [Spongiivirga citrea]NER17013.1 response regulator [Spongiivirga citrea]